MKELLKLLFVGFGIGAIRVFIYFISIPIMLLIMGFLAWIFGVL